VCSSGTYIRTLADDIAGALGGRAHLVGLRRTRIGSLQVDAAVTMDELVEDPARLDAEVLSLAEGLADLGQLTVDDDLGRRISHGSVLTTTELPIEHPTAVLDGDGNLLAVYALQGTTVRPEVVLA
jgi:tRNA pseudouridine55 synthase